MQVSLNDSYLNRDLLFLRKTRYLQCTLCMTVPQNIGNQMMNYFLQLIYAVFPNIVLH